MTTTTRVPAAVDGLYEFYRGLVGTLGEPAVQVCDGAATQPLEELAADVVLIGATVGSRQAVTGTRDGPGGLTSHDSEVFTIGVVVSCVRDVGETKKARDRVAEIVALLEVNLKADMTMGGTVNRARIGPSFSWDVAKCYRGEAEAIEVAKQFGVEIRALL